MLVNHLGSVLPRLLALAILAAPQIGDASDFESPPVLDAKVIIGDVPLVGEYYSIIEAVPTDGFMATVTIASPFGEFTASGPGMVQSRLNEIRALAAIERLQDDEQFMAAAENSALDTVGGLRTLAENPQETLKGVPQGVGRFFNRTGRTIRTGLQKLDDARQGQLPGVDNDAISTLPGGPSEPVDEQRTGLAETFARAGGNVAIDVLGFEDQRRRLAKDLAVDPYTTNPVLSKELDEVTWAAFAGGLGVNLVKSMIPGGMIISASTTLTDWVWDSTPGDLRVEIERELLSAGVSREDIDRFLRHHWYTLSMQTVLATSLDALDGVGGRAAVVPLALSVGSEGQARFVVQTVEMLKRYHREIEPLSELVVLGTVIGRTQNGDIAVVAPVDYLSWTPRLDAFASVVLGIRTEPRALYVAGGVSDRAREELVERGWTVEENSALGPVE